MKISAAREIPVTQKFLRDGLYIDIASYIYMTLHLRALRRAAHEEMYRRVHATVKQGKENQ